MAGRDKESEQLWYHGTQYPADWHETGFKKPKDVQGAGQNGSDAGEGTYLTSDRSWAEEHAFGLDGVDAGVPEPGSSEREEWRDSTAAGRVLSVQFRPKNPAYYDYSKGSPDEYSQAKAARKAGHDAIVGDQLAVSFKPHKNAKIVKAMTYQDLHWRNHTPEQAAANADYDQEWRR